MLCPSCLSLGFRLAAIEKLKGFRQTDSLLYELDEVFLPLNMMVGQVQIGLKPITYKRKTNGDKT